MELDELYLVVRDALIICPCVYTAVVAVFTLSDEPWCEKRKSTTDPEVPTKP